MKSSKNLSRVGATLAALVLLTLTQAFGQEPTPLLTKSAAEWVTVLQSGASQKEKADACRELAVIGGKDAVPALAALLPDALLSHMARYALETIPDPSASAALREALGKVKGRQLAGVLGSLGVRHDVEAIKPIAALLGDNDADVAQAAARALGKIGGVEAAGAIQNALGNTAEGNRLAFCEGLFRCAEGLQNAAKAADARAIFERLGDPKAPHQVRAGAFRGLVLLGGAKQADMIQQAVKGTDSVLCEAAARLAVELKDPQIGNALRGIVATLPEDRQVLVLAILGKRAELASLTTLADVAKKTGSATTRVAAVRAMGELSKPDASVPLVNLLQDADREVAQAAQETLASIAGPEVDATVVAMLAAGKPAMRVTAAELIGRRRMLTALPALVKAAGDNDQPVRLAALKRIGEMGGEAELAPLLELLGKATEQGNLDAIEQALSLIGARGDNAAKAVGVVSGRFAAAQPAQRVVLLRVLASLGGDPAFKTVRGAVSEQNPAVHDAALRLLGSWKTAEAAKELLGLAKSAPDMKDRRFALRELLSWISGSELGAAERMAMCKQAAELLQGNDEKKLYLGTLGSIRSVESATAVAGYLEDAAVKDEAVAAIAAIAEELLKQKEAPTFAPSLVNPLTQAVQATANQDLAKRVQAQLELARKKAGQ